MVGIGQNLVLFALITISLRTKNNILGFSISMVCIILAFMSCYRWFYRAHKIKRGTEIRWAMVTGTGVLIIYLMSIELTVYDKSQILYVLFQIAYLTSLMEGYMEAEVKQKVRKIMITDDIGDMSASELIAELDTLITSIGTRNNNAMDKYNKIEGFRKMQNYGMNIFQYIVCHSLAELEKACNKFDYICTIRSDANRDKAKYANMYPFYIVNGKESVDYRDIENKVFKEGFVAIVANGLKYDKYLNYNMVVYMTQNGGFQAEYSFEQVPLRKMYNNSSYLHYVSGNINDSILYWDRTFLGSDNKLDMRVLKDLLNKQYELRYEYKLFDREIEFSRYSVDCGILADDIIYWQV